MRLLTVLLLLPVLGLMALLSPARAERQLLFLGDSLTAGLGVEVEEAFPVLVGEMLRRDGFADVAIINGGVSGSTSAGGAARLKWYAAKRPSLLFLALGANDGLRGLTVEEMKNNLGEIIRQAKGQGMSVILAGMEVPPNYGDEYASAFRTAFQDLASQHQVRLLPFLLEGVAGIAAMNQADGIHPNAAGHQRIARLVYPVVREELAAFGDRRQRPDHPGQRQEP